VAAEGGLKVKTQNISGKILEKGARGLEKVDSTGEGEGGRGGATLYIYIYNIF
jgi:hypothetical protein